MAGPVPKGSGISSDRAVHQPTAEASIAIRGNAPGSLTIGVRHCLVRDQHHGDGRRADADEEMPDPSMAGPAPEGSGISFIRAMTSISSTILFANEGNA
jgi:hypothetical protein